MKRYTIILFISALFLGGCDTSQYSQEEKAVLIEAQKAHFEALDKFGDGMDMLESITALQDSLDDKIQAVGRMMDVENADIDSLSVVNTTLMAANDNLNTARNEFLAWADNIYGLPEADGVFDQEQDNSRGIAKDDQNDMISNNIRYKELPENISPEELRTMQTDQLEEIEVLTDELQSSIEDAKQVLAENL